MVVMMFPNRGGIIAFVHLIVFVGSIAAYCYSKSASLFKYSSTRLPSFRQNEILDRERLVIITGATGTLGSAIRQALLQSRLMLSYRTSTCHISDAQWRKSSMDQNFPLASEVWFPLEVSSFEEKWLWGLADSSSLYPFSSKHAFARIEQSSSVSLPSISKDLFSERSYPPIKQLVLINNAAICEKGRSFNVFYKALAVNTLLPMWMTAQLLAQVIALGSCSLEEVVVINISSGDGEKVFIDSDLIQDIYPNDESYFAGQAQKKHLQCDNLVNFQQYITQCMLPIFKSLSFGEQSMRREIATGDTPSYSLSKALLNRFTQLLGQETFADPLKSLGVQFRAHGICPGNFASPMTTEEELLLSTTSGHHRIRHVDDAAKDVVCMTENRGRRYNTGVYYRYGEPICV